MYRRRAGSLLRRERWLERLRYVIAPSSRLVLMLRCAGNRLSDPDVPSRPRRDEEIGISERSRFRDSRLVLVRRGVARYYRHGYANCVVGHDRTSSHYEDDDTVATWLASFVYFTNSKDALLIHAYRIPLFTRYTRLHYPLMVRAHPPRNLRVPRS